MACRRVLALETRSHLEGQGDLVSRFRMGLISVTVWGLSTYLLSPPDPPSKLSTSEYVLFWWSLGPTPNASALGLHIVGLCFQGGSELDEENSQSRLDVHMRTKSKVVPQRGKGNKALSDTGSRPKRVLKGPYFSEVWYIAVIAVVSLRWLPEAVWLSHHNEKDIHWHTFYFWVLGS